MGFQPEILPHLRRIHAAIRDAVIAACATQSIAHLSAPVGYEGGDTIFAVDRVSEAVLLEQFAALAEAWPLVLIAEGLGERGWTALPAGLPPEQAELRIIVDPIDGTRGLMYQKRPAWVLTGVAPNRGPATGLADIELAVMTEIPLLKQHLCDSIWAAKGQGAHGERLNRLDGTVAPLRPAPSQSHTIAYGFGGISRFFPGARDTLAAIEEALIARILGPQPPNTAYTFEDQYLSTGGQLYELIMGHDRWQADLRPLLAPILARRGLPPSLCCHPYDLCAELVAREAGVIVSDPAGRPLNAPLDVHTDVAWLGFANPHLHDQIAPVLREILAEHGL